MKLPFKVVLIYLAAVLSVFLLVNFVGSNRAEKAALEQIKAENLEKVDVIADEYVERSFESNASAWEMLKQMIVLGDVSEARIWVINSKRVVVSDTEGNGYFDLNDYSDYFQIQSVSENVVIPGIIHEPSLVITAPIVYDYGARGYVCLITPMSKASERALAYMDSVNLILLSVAGILLVAFLIIYLVVAWPLRKMRTAALEYAKGNYGYELKVKGHDESREMAEALRYMVDRIQDVDEYQKKFIANISHDFRSPLTSIRGYAQAIEDGTIPPEMQKKYLDIILFETDRLTKLTTNLLDLNRIDDKGLMLDISTFDINQIIKQTAASFEGSCTQKKIMLDLSFAALETLVDADMGRIQQVLYNLTDNAIKFSNPGSVVEIETEEKGSKLLVRVRDHGCGIARDNLKKIWDRFYKTDSSRGKDKKGTGLGLSIVKEVISAHGENINVISTEGVGTEFTFTLPLNMG